MNENKKPANTKSQVAEAEKRNQVAPNGNKVTITEPQGNGEENSRIRAEFWKSRFDAANNTQRPMMEKWGKWYNDMYAQINTSDMAAWRSRVYLPIISSKVWDLIARFIQYKPGWEVSIRSIPESMDNATYAKYIQDMNVKYDKVKLKLDFDYDNPIRETPIQDEIQSVMIDAAVTGTGVARVQYDSRTIEDKEHVTRGDLVDLSLEKITTSHEGFNGFDAVNIFNFYISPYAKNMQDAAWIIVRDFIGLSELQRRDNYVNLDKLTVGKVSDDTAQFQTAKNPLLSNPDVVSLDGSLNLIETYECWDRESKMCTVYAKSGSNWVEIFRQPNIYWHGKYPFVSFYIRRKPHQFWGESLFENTETLQSAINDVFNHYMDSLNMSDGMMAIEEGSVVEPFVIEPAGEFRYRGEAPKQWKFPEPNPAQLSTVINQITQAIENSTISQYASGVPNSATDSTQGTATGITRLMEAAAEKVGMMRSNFRRSWREVGNLWNSNTQQFMDKDVVTTRKEKGKSVTEIISPIELIGVFNLKVDDGSFEPVSKDEQRKNYMDYVANLSTWANASIQQAQRTGDQTQALNLDFHSIALRGSEVYGENFNNFILAPMAQATQAIDNGADPIMAAENALAQQGVPAEAPTGQDATQAVQPANTGVATPADSTPQGVMGATTPRTIGSMGTTL